MKHCACCGMFVVNVYKTETQQRKTIPTQIFYLSTCLAKLSFISIFFSSCYSIHQTQHFIKNAENNTILYIREKKMEESPTTGSGVT